MLERLVKWNGEAHAEVTPGEYTQLTGRAGRRGIDVEGHAVVLWQPDLDITAVAGLASTRTYPLRSSFRPSYNMAVNLIRQFGVERSRELLEQSFAQFQTDQAVVGLVRQIRRNEEALLGYADAMRCHLGEFEEYAALRQQLSEREKRAAKSRGTAKRSAVIASLEALRPGDVIDVPAGRRAGIAVVLDPGMSGGDGPRPLVLTAGRQVRRLSLVDFPSPPEPLGQDPGAEGFRRPLAAVAPRSRLDAARQGLPGQRAADDQRERPGGGEHARTARSSGCARRSERTRATAARIARTTRGGRSATRA